MEDGVKLKKMDEIDARPKKTQPIKWAWTLTRRRKHLSDEFFEEGDTCCNQNWKQIAVNVREELNNNNDDSSVGYPCQVSTCNQTFQSMNSYELHYRTCHCNVCQTCKRSFPTDHLLEIHIQERHDAMFEILAQKQNMYQCLLPSCGCKFSTAKVRKDHMVKSHKYPANFRFDKPPKKSKPMSAQSSTSPEDAATMEVDVPLVEQSTTTEYTGKTSGGTSHSGSDEKKSHTSESGRRFVFNVPRTLCFGHGVSRGFYYPQKKSGKKKTQRKDWHKVNQPENMDTAVDIREVKMQDLAAALE